MEADWAKWVARNEILQNACEVIDFQTDYVQELARDCGADYPYDLDVSEIFHTWEGHKDQDVLSYRDKSFASKFTGEKLWLVCSIVIIISQVSSLPFITQPS